MPGERSTFPSRGAKWGTLVNAPRLRYRSMDGITIATLGDLAQGYSLTAHCRDCGHSRRLHTLLLVHRLGAAYKIAEVHRRLICVGCSGRDIQITLHPMRTGPELPGQDAPTPIR